ncbi:MAG: TonB-dependent receptor, partial [Bacteroidota bacterium]
MQSSFNQDAQSDQHSFFAEISPDWHDDISLTFGIRSTYDRLTDKIYQSPRLRFSYQFDQHLSLKASWAQYNQFIRQANYEDRFGKDFDYWVISDDVSYPVSSSKQWMAGFQLLKGQWKLDVEFYERNTEGVVEQAKSRNAAPNSMEIDQDFELFIGSGRSQGMDVLLEKTSGNYTGWVAYTLSKTTVSFPDILDGKEFPSVDDRRHQLKWINQYRWKRWNFSATYLFSNGRPYTDLTILTDTKDRRDTEPRERISLLADYHRIDVGLGYGFEWGRSKWNLGASVVNLTDRSNVGYRQSYFTFIDEEDSVERINTLSSEVRLLDFTPNISLSINF